MVDFKCNIGKALFVIGIKIGVRRDVVMIDSIRWGDAFGVSKRVDRTGPPADEEASNNFYDIEFWKLEEPRSLRSILVIHRKL